MGITRLFETEAAGLKRFLARFGRAISAEDVVQEAFLRLCAVSMSNIASPRAYLFAAARNLARDSIRSANANPVESVAEIDRVQGRAHSRSPEDARIEAEDAQALREALAALPSMQREALLLRRVERLPPEEVARRLGVSERHMQRLVRQAIAFCHARLVGDSASPLD